MFPRMNRASLALPLALVLASGGVRLPVRADDVLPQPVAAGRYQKMADRSPFAPPTTGPATQVALPPPPGPKWSDNLTVTLVTQLGGVYYATIQDKAKNEHFLLQSNKEDLDRQLALTSIEWGALVSQTTVTLRHNNEFASVRFDPNAAISPPAANPAAMPPRGPVPGTYPPAAGAPLLGRSQPPPNPAGLPGNVQRRGLIRSTPTVTAPSLPSPPNALRRPLANRNDDNDQ